MKVTNCPECGKMSIKWEVKLLDVGASIRFEKCTKCSHVITESEMRDFLNFNTGNKNKS